MCETGNTLYTLPQTLSMSSTGLLPSTTEFGGDLNFELFLDPLEATKKKWLYSSKLRKIFIDINRIMCLHFKWDFIHFLNKELYIRALPVYTQDDWLTIPVERCPVHVSSTDNANSGGGKNNTIVRNIATSKYNNGDIQRTQNNGFSWVDHVLRCENPGTQYQVDEFSRRKSCVTPVFDPLPETEHISLLYKFVCKTSCYRGMQRRPIIVIFTLEDASGLVLGRRCLTFKICSCLKRDRQREEDDWDRITKTARVEVQTQTSNNKDEGNSKNMDMLKTKSECSNQNFELLNLELMPFDEFSQDPLSLDF